VISFMPYLTRHLRKKALPHAFTMCHEHAQD
jgi:hypothetical protein